MGKSKGGTAVALAAREPGALDVVLSILEKLAERQERLESMLATPPAPALPPPVPRITLRVAAELSGFGVGYLERLIRDGKLRAVKGGKYGAWVVRRADVEALEL